MTNQWLVEFLFPEKLAIVKGYFPVNWEEVHEYSQRARNGNKIPYAYRTFCSHYGKYANKYKLTMPIRRKPSEIMEVDWSGMIIASNFYHSCSSFYHPLHRSLPPFVEAFTINRTSYILSGHAYLQA